MPPRSPSAPEQLVEPSPSENPSPSPLPGPTPMNPLFSESRSQELPTDPEPVSLPSPGAFDESAGPEPGSPSAPRSTGSSARARLRELKKTAAAAIATAGGIAHQLLTREGSPERAHELWVPDEEDVEAISDPLASLASRRLPEGVENPDVTDLIRLAFGVLGYVLKQRVKSEEIQRSYAPPVQPDDGQPGAWQEVAEPSYP